VGNERRFIATSGWFVVLGEKGYRVCVCKRQHDLQHLELGNRMEWRKVKIEKTKHHQMSFPNNQTNKKT
jgi:hypothetical protein